jgi:hypothetical protein
MLVLFHNFFSIIIYVHLCYFHLSIAIYRLQFKTFLTLAGVVMRW